MKKIKIRDNLDDFRLICIKDKEIGGFTVYLERFPLLIVEVKKLKDAPKEIATSIEAILKYGFDTNIHEIHEPSHEKN